MRAFTIKSSDIARCPFRILAVEHYNEDGTCRCETATCIHCERTIVNDPDEGWIDPEAGYDDEDGDGVWRTTCDSHDTFDAVHEPDEPDEPDGAPCCMDPDCPGRRGGTDGCTFPGYADNH